MEIKYPLAKETIDKNDIGLLISWLKKYPKLTKGDLTLEFEQRWADYIGTKYSVFCNSGSSANLLMSAVIQKTLNKERFNVVVPSVGWITTISPFIQSNNCNLFMLDADKNTFGIDLDQLEELCKLEQIDIVIFVQVLGIPHYKKRLLELKKKYGFKLLEDACAALGAKYSDKKMVGTVGDMSSFSFYFGHQLSTIEGGMVNTNSKEIYDLLLMYRSHGWGKDLDEKTYNKLMKQNNIDTFHQPFTFFEPGYNLRSTDLQAFLGNLQIDKADWVTMHRNRNHLIYAEELKGFKYQQWDKNYPVSISFGCLANNETHKKNIIKALVENGIETRIFSAGNLSRHPFWKQLEKRKTDLKFFANNLLVADEIHELGFFLPNYPELRPEEIRYICNIVKNVVPF